MSEAAPDAAGAGTPQWRRLSRRMLLVHPVQELIRMFPALLGLLLAGHSSSGGSWWSLAAVGVLIAIGIARWFTTSYRISAQQVQVRRGLLNRKVLAVPRDRIRTVDVTSHMLHRVLGLARVEIGTGRSDRKNGGGIKLDALRALDAARLHEELLHGRESPSAPEASEPTADRTGQDADETVLLRLRPGWARYGPCTLSGFVTIGVLAGLGSRVVSEAHLSADRGPVRAALDQLTAISLPLAILEVVVAATVAASIAAVCGYVLAFWGFVLVRNAAGTLRMRRGLLTTRTTTIEERRLRGVELSEPLLLRAVRGARLIAITTGLRVGGGAERGGSLLAPPAPGTVARRVATDVLGDASAIQAELTRHGPRARRRRYTRAMGGCAVVIAALAAGAGTGLLPLWAPVAALALLPCAAATAADRYRALGHALTTDRIVTRRGSLVRRRAMVSRDGIIGWNMRASLFQRHAGLLTLSATTAAGRQAYPVQDVPAGAAIELARAATPGLLEPFLADAPSDDAAPRGNGRSDAGDGGANRSEAPSGTR